jgi:plastocyanin
MNRFIRITFASALLALVGGSFSALAGTNTIQVGGASNIFVPATTNIAQGNTVIWVWAGLNHNTVSDTGIWNSGLPVSAPHSFTNTFPNVGTFPFFCSFHGAAGGIGMSGVITVSGTVPPTVAVTSPANGVILSAPASLILGASASGDVTNVQFFQNTTTSLGNDTTSPYSIPVNSLAAGDYTFSAVASGNTGLKATNSVTVHVVTPVAINLSNVKRLSDSSFRFDYSANVGLNYVVQRSTNLFDWISLITNTAASNPETYTDGAATLNPGFYRVGRLPNP